MAQFDAQGTLYIPYEEWYEFIQKKFPHLQTGQFVLSQPVLGCEDLQVEYALGTDDVHPKEWATKPYWLERQLKGDK